MQAIWGQVSYVTSPIIVLTIVFQFALCGHVWRSYEPKTKPNHLVIDLTSDPLTWDLKFGYQSLRLVTADILVFDEALSQLRAKWRGGRTLSVMSSPVITLYLCMSGHVRPKLTNSAICHISVSFLAIPSAYGYVFYSSLLAFMDATLDTIYNWLRIKITQGHASQGQFSEHLLGQFSRCK